MRVSRAPEKRGGANKMVVYLSIAIGVVIVGILITYLTTGFDSRSATGDQTGIPEMAANPGKISNQIAPPPTAILVPTATAQPPLELKLLDAEPGPAPRIIPDVKFGEVLDEGLLDIDLPGNVTSQSWYTFQVDTISVTVMVSNLGQGEAMRKVEWFYKEATRMMGNTRDKKESRAQHWDEVTRAADLLPNL